MRTATGLTPYDTHRLQQALPPTPAGLTPNPSPRGEGRKMPCCGVVGFVVAKGFVSFSPRGGIEVMLR